MLRVSGFVMQEAPKKRGRRDADELPPSQGGKVAAAIHKGIGEAPSLVKANSVPPCANRHVAMAAVAAAAAAAVVSLPAAAVVSLPAAAVQARQSSPSSLSELLRAEFRKRNLAIPSRLASDSSMQAVVQLAETLYVDEILKDTSGNVSLAGKIAKIT
jgi:hypothetical protein